MRLLRSFTIVAAAAILVAGSEAHAQNVCLPNASGVPFLSGPPNWFDAAQPQPQYWPEVDDPRWRGSFLYTFGGAAASEHVAFRGLRTATHLYLIWNVTVDPQLDEFDELWVAFSPGPGQDDMLIQVVPFSNSNTDVNPPQTPAAVQVLTRTPGAAFVAQPGLPNWLQTATTDLRVIRVVGGGRWAVMMRVPIAAPPNGLNLANTFHMWSATMVTHPAGVAEYNYPTGIDLNNVLASTNNTGWSSVRRDVAPTDASCIKGVSIVSSDIGTEGGGASCAVAASTLSSNINLTVGGALGSTVLCARPFNESGAQIPATDLDATFRIANWGTQPTDPAAINTVWTTVNPTPATNAAAVANNTKGSLTFNWQMTANDGTVNDVCTFTPQPAGIVCNPLPPTPRWIHQCMLVELSGAPGITFPVSSVARNMNFVQASTFRREAEVSVRGLPPLPGSPPQRDVFLYVQADNMPAQVTNGGGPRPGSTPPVGIAKPRTSVASSTQPGKVEPLEKTQYAKLRETEPTYQVHGFHDTGQTLTLRGRSYKVLEPQSSFGYFVDHTGTLLGWRHELQGADLIAPDYYKVRVNQNGTTTVTTLIEAIESRWSLSAHGGFNVPIGDFADRCDGGLSVGLDAEYRFTGVFAAEVFYGHERIDCDDADALHHLSVNGKVYFGQVMWKPFVGAGIGRYDLSPGPAATGTNVFGGVQVDVRPRVAIEATAKWHLVEIGGADSNFFTLQGGVRVRF